MVNTCFIVDDEIHAISILKELISEVPGFVVVGYNQNPIIAIEEINALNPNIVFLDIKMPKLSGMSLTKLLTVDSKIVFTTAYKAHALDAFDNNAFDYLLKPISYERLLQCLNKVKIEVVGKNDHPKTLPEPSSCLYLKSENKGKFVKVNFEDIFYIEANNNNVIFNLASSKFISYHTLKEVEQQLPLSMFIRIHKSFIVNKNKISIVDGNQLNLLDKTVLQIGSSYRNSFFQFIDANLLKSQK